MPLSEIRVAQKTVVAADDVRQVMIAETQLAEGVGQNRCVQRFGQFCHGIRESGVMGIGSTDDKAGQSRYAGLDALYLILIRQD